MRSFQWLAITVGIAALAGCGGDEVNQTNVEINAAEDNLALPPADLNADMKVDNNAEINADTKATDKTAMNNTADKTTNTY
jgi:predicted small lipoprotein YifL